MAELKFHRGYSTNLNSIPLVDGQLIFTIDRGDWFTDVMVDGTLTRVGSNLAGIASILNNHLKVHAPSDAEKNVIVGLTRNGTALEVSADRTVNIEVPEAKDLIVVSDTKPEQACLWCKVLREETIDD